MIEFDDAVRVVGKPNQRHTDIKTLPYPGFPTDMQPQMAVTLALTKGTSMVTESILRIVLNTWTSWHAWEALSR